MLPPRSTESGSLGMRLQHQYFFKSFSGHCEKSWEPLFWMDSHPSIHPVIHSFKNYLLSISYAPGTFPALMELTFCLVLSYFLSIVGLPSCFIFLGSKITVDGDRSHKVKRHLLLGRKAMINLHSILKSREIILPTKVCIIKVMVFLGVMYGCESWIIKKPECQRINACKLWCWRRLLRVILSARRSN